MTLSLSQRSIEREQLPLGHAIDAFSPNCEEIRLQIGIDREQVLLLDGKVQFDRKRGVLTNVPFGMQFYAGLRLVGSVDPSGEVIRLFAKRLITPVVIEGVRLEFEFDEDLYLSAVRLGKRIDLDRPRQAGTFSELISRVFRTRGISTPDGALALFLREVVVALIGPDADLETARVVAAGVAGLDQLPDGRYLWRPEITRKTKVTDVEVIAAFRASEAGERLRHVVKAHPVLMHLRRNPPRDDGKWRDRAEQYQKELVAAGAQHRLPSELPRDCTFVTAHHRGMNDGPTDNGDEVAPLTTIQLMLFSDSGQARM